MIETNTSTLGNIGKVCMCKRILKEQTSPTGDIPFYKISTFGDKADCYISREIYEDYKTRFSFPKKGDILISAAGTLGRTVIYDGEDAFFQDSNIVWIDNDETKVLNDYLYYFYQTNPWIRIFGSTISRLYNDNIRSVSITYPKDIGVQKEIVNVLKTIDLKISNNNAICSDLEAMAKLLYDYWFVQFDFPDENGMPYKSSGGKMVWNEELKREIPEGWEVKPLSGLSYYVNDRVESKTLSPDTYIGTDNLLSDMKGRTSSDYTPEDGYSTSFNKNDVLVANIRPYFKKIWLSDIEGGCSADVLVIRSIDISNAAFLYSTLARNDFFAYDMAGSKGSKMPRGDKEHIMRYPVPFCREIVQAFSIIVSEFFGLVAEKYYENQQLASLRDFLLPMLMNGQVKVGQKQD